MAHEIFGSRFISLRVPAWHNLGEVIQEPIGALEALRRMGDYVTTLVPIYAEVATNGFPQQGLTLADGSALDANGKLRIQLDQRAIVRHPTDDDPEFVPFGVVGPEYQLITPGDVCTVWDEFVGKPIETIGVLRRGANFFVTSKLPSIDVKGDEVERYLGATSPLDGERVATAEEWDLRVVCANTLAAAQAQTRTAYRIVHDATARERMGEWLADAYSRAEQNAELLREAFTVLANTQVNDDQARRVFRVAFPEPRPPRHDAPQAVIQNREAFRDYLAKRMQARRDTALKMFQGAGTGMSHVAAKGTAWGVYNSVVEVEDYRRGSFRGGNEAANVAEAVLFGERREPKERAFAACMTIAERELARA